MVGRYYPIIGILLQTWKCHVNAPNKLFRRRIKEIDVELKKFEAVGKRVAGPEKVQLVKVSTFSDCKTLGLIILQQTETLQADGIKRVKKTY